MKRSKMGPLIDSAPYFVRGCRNRAPLMPRVSERASDSYEAAARMAWHSWTWPPRPPYSSGMKTESGVIDWISRIMNGGSPRWVLTESKSPRIVNTLCSFLLKASRNVSNSTEVPMSSDR